MATRASAPAVVELRGSEWVATPDTKCKMQGRGGLRVDRASGRSTAPAGAGRKTVRLLLAASIACRPWPIWSSRVLNELAEFVRFCEVI